MVPMGVIWHAWCLYFGVLGDPGTTLGRSWDIGRHKEGPCMVQAWILLIFVDLGARFLELFWILFDKKERFFNIYLQVVFSDDFWV